MRARQQHTTSVSFHIGLPGSQMNFCKPILPDDFHQGEQFPKGSQPTGPWFQNILDV